MAPEIDEDHANFPSEISIDRSGTIQYRDAEIQRQAGPRTNLSFVTPRQFERETCWDPANTAR